MSEQDYLKQLEERIKSHESAVSIFYASSAIVVAGAIKDSGFLQEAKDNPEFASDLLKICLKENNNVDMFVQCVAFSVFKHVNFKEALPYIIDYVEKNADKPCIMAWNQNMATNTLVHLTGQEDPNPYMYYTREQRKEASKKAKEYLNSKT